jgi:O-antigen/teichoic acid export membrane protein
MQLIAPINVAIYPKFTELVTFKNQVELVKTFRHSCQLMSAIIIPPALVLIIFAEKVLLVWTGDPNLSIAAAPILSLLTLGTLFNGFMNVPYILQLAHGWTGFTLRVNLIAVSIIVPATLWVVPLYGVIGAAWVWVLLNLGYLLVAAHFMYRRLMIGEKLFWYKKSILKPMFFGSLTAWLISLIIDIPTSHFMGSLSILFVGILVTLSVVCSIPEISQRFIFNLKRMLVSQ